MIDENLQNGVSSQAKASPRLRMNYNFHQSLEDKCHRMLNAVEPGTDIPIHRHPTKDESFVVLRGKVRSTTYNDDGSVIESVVLSQEDGLYGVDIPKGVWHRGIRGTGTSIHPSNALSTQYIDIWSSSSLQGIVRAS